MKKFILLFTFSICLMPYAFPQEYGWKDISENIPQTGEYPPSLSDVFFVSDNEGWITSSTYAEIYHTTDGGETFEIQTTLIECNAIHMLDENEGYAGGYSGFVYRTIDGGENWTLHGSIGTTLADITFPPNGNNGYCCGLNGNIWTFDSTSVTKMTSNINSNFYSINFPISSEEGWVCGGEIIIHFSNNVWNADQDYPSVGNNALYMIDNLNGCMVGDIGIISRTENGWNWVSQINPDPQNNTLYNVFFLNNNEGWTVGLGSQILHTTDGGNNWAVKVIGDAQLNAVHFTSPTNGYVVGNNKTLLKYTEVSGIDEKPQPIAFELFPNPAKNKIQIKCSEFKTESGIIEILSVDGKKILEKEIEAGNDNIELDLNKLKSGMYLCKISIDKKSTTKKLIIE